MKISTTRLEIRVAKLYIFFLPFRMIMPFEWLQGIIGPLANYFDLIFHLWGFILWLQNEKGFYYDSLNKSVLLVCNSIYESNKFYQALKNYNEYQNYLEAKRLYDIKLEQYNTYAEKKAAYDAYIKEWLEYNEALKTVHLWREYEAAKERYDLYIEQ